jgi:hypothetical protein
MIRRSYALIVLGVGLAVLVASVLKLLPGGLALGGGLAFLGCLMLGLSFVPVKPTPEDAPPPMSAVERIAGMFYQPARVYESLRARPHWLAALLLIAVLSFAYTQAFVRRLTPERIAEFTTSKVVESGFVQPEMAEKMKQDQVDAAKSPIRVVGSGVNQFVSMFVVMAILGALFMLAVMMFGGRIGYWQAFAMAIHSAVPIVIIQRLLSLAILYVKDPEGIHPLLGQETLVTDNLGVLFSPAEHPVLFSMATFIGVLSFYRLWLMATGFRHTGERVSSTSSWAIAIIFWLLGLIIAVASSALFGNFLS